MPYQLERERLVAAARRLAEAGLSPGASGNLSLLAIDGLLLTTPTGGALRRLTLETVVGIATDGAIAFGTGPSKELGMHRAAYRSRPAARAIVHLHSPYATAISCLPPDAEGRAALPRLTRYHEPRLGSVPLIATARPGSEELADLVGRAAEGASVLLLANHGLITIADDLETAADLAEELEAAAQLALLTSGLDRRIL